MAATTRHNVLSTNEGIDIEDKNPRATEARTNSRVEEGSLDDVNPESILVRWELSGKTARLHRCDVLFRTSILI